MKYIKSLFIFIISIFLLNIIISIFNYFDLFNDNIIKIFKIISILISSLLSGLYLGFKSDKKGYLEGLKLSFIVIIIFTIINLITCNFNIFTILYYLIISILITISTILGINIKKSK